MFGIAFLKRRIGEEALRAKLNGKYRQNLGVDELYSGIGLKKSYQWRSSYHPHTVAHLCNQFNHVFAVLISTPRFKGNNFYQTRPKIKVLLQKNPKIFERWELCPQTLPWLSAAGGSAPIPKNVANCSRAIYL